MTNRKKDFQQRNGVCSYCEYEGHILVFENEVGDEVELCGACLEEALDDFNGDFIPRED